MRIGIDASLLAGTKTGIGWYTYNLITNLTPFIEEGGDELFLYSNQPLDMGLTIPVKSKIIEGKGQKRTLWMLTRLPTQLARDRLDVFHCTGSDSVPFYRGKTITTIYDLAIKKYPEDLSRRALIAFRFFIPLAARKAQRIITISQASRRDLEFYYPNSIGKINMIPIAGDPFYRRVHYSASTTSRYRRKLKICRPFALFVGLNKRKNLEHVLEALSQLKSHLDLQLVLCGVGGSDMDHLPSKIAALGIDDRVVLTGYVTREELRFLYNQARMFVYPSLFEGFGMPVLEAMTCGTPVITSNVSSLPEVAGQAALMVNPQDVTEIRQAMVRLATDRQLRDELIRRGLQHARTFTWKKVAQETLKIYREVARETRHA